MNILVINCGSSSIKCSIFNFSASKHEIMNSIWDHEISWKNIQNEKNLKLIDLFEPIFSEKKIDLIGHRIVHGTDKYIKCTRIDADVKKDIQSFGNLAPLHNFIDLAAIEVLEKLFPTVPQFAVFDTAFHHTLPESVYTYPGPFKWLKMGIRKFGFHGISFQYCAKAAEKLLKIKKEKIVICHLGSGASLCALLQGKSVDTTMGFTPLDGLMMNTRCGSIDPGILLYLLENDKTTLPKLSSDLYEQSGLLGLSEISSDMRDVLIAYDQNDPRAKLTIEVYLHRLISCIGSMIASLGGLDVLIFTGGIGENCPFIQRHVANKLSFLGIQLCKEAKKGDAILSTEKSKILVLQIHTREDFEIASECWKDFKNVKSIF